MLSISISPRLVSGLTAVLLLVAAPTMASAQDAPDAPAPEEMSVTEVQLGTALEAGAVTSPATSFSRTAGRIYAVVRLANPAAAATTVRVALERVGGSASQGLALDVPARRRYRTVARFGASHAPGNYRVVVRTEDGRELSSTELTITE